MCGIAGLVDARSMSRDDVDAVALMVGRLQHRGPDARGVRLLSDRTDRAAVLGAVRLRIVDLDPTGDQPMSAPDGRVWTVFNGEIYNFREIRADLEKRGFQFRTGTDTECLVHLYRHLDNDVEAMAARLRGMFAFALWDEDLGRLALVRDRLGIKPLYYAATKNGLAFCSEQRPLLAAAFAEGTIPEAALSTFLAKGVVAQSTPALTGVATLPPGSLLVWDGSSRVTQWWRAEPRAAASAVTKSEAIDLVSGALRNSVERHLVADRPVGMFLSSGTDSLAVATAAATAGIQHALTVTFPDAPDASEWTDAARVAGRLGVAHSAVPFTGSDANALVSTFLNDLDAPTSDGFNTWIVCRAAKEAGMVVALSGLGGDELFGGYRTFQLVPRLAKLMRLAAPAPRSVRRVIASLLRSTSRTRPFSRALNGETGIGGAYHSMRRIFEDSEIMSLGFPPPVLTPERPVTSAVDAVMLLELESYLRDQLLPDADVMSMSHSIELRVPLLDDDLVAIALGLPAQFRSEGKWLLASAAGLDRIPPKRPFALPYEAWMRGPMNSLVQESLLSDELRLADELPRSFRKKVWHDFGARQAHWSQAWSIVVLRQWATVNNVRGVSTQRGAKTSLGHSA